MNALVFSEASGLSLQEKRPKPIPEANEALIKVLRAGICSTDLEILRGYIPGYNGVLGHEFVGSVAECSSRPHLVGARVVGEINCRCDLEYSHADPIFLRNHAPQRTVLGIIAKDGTMAEYLTLPVENLHMVPDVLTDQEACFAEPLAAACRIAEQQVIRQADRVAVVGDGKLGLLVAQALAVQGLSSIVHFGKHEAKLRLVQGTRWETVDGATAQNHAQEFDVVIEASGSSQGIMLASALTRPMGTIVLKSTCSAVNDEKMPKWSDIANDVVVNEKRLQGSRCGPFEPALAALQDARVKALVNGMVTEVFPLARGVEAVAAAQQKGAVKVQLLME